MSFAVVQPLPDGTRPATDGPAASTAPRGRRGRAAGAPRLFALDGLRLIAALSVLAFHWTALADAPEIWSGHRPAEFMPTLSRFTSYGWLGVQLFFVISGFVICMSCWGKRPGDFLVSRVVRIVPAYWAAVLMTSAVLLLVPDLGRRLAREGLDGAVVLANLTLFQSSFGVKYVDGVYWTLWVELVFYLLFAVVVRMGLTYRRVVAFCGIWSVAALFAPMAKIPLLSLVVVPNEAPFFIAGIAIYLMHRFGPDLLLWGVVGFSWLTAMGRIDSLKSAFEASVAHTLSWNVVALAITLAFAAVIAIALGLLDRVRWKGLTVAGALTYPLYLIHQEAGFTLIHWLRTLGLRSAAALAVALVTVLLAAWLLHRLVERPGGKLLKRHLGRAVAGMREVSTRA
ncbi:acyltransferase family protein [Kitasatospora camelliae]|uniref:Acyltransferase n=1 Tax=Kitasatospora camelliae TaxID=3156397 RepID=A0AAU8K3C8_9ACTN